MLLPQIADLDAKQTLARAEEVVARRRAVEVEDLRVVAHWAVLHGEDPQARPGAVPVWAGGDRLVRLGGQGTPRVAELAVAELAIARGVHPVAGQRVVADVLDLIHRLPRTWEAVAAGHGEVWVARRVAVMTRSLPLERVGLVDAAVAGVVGSLAPSRVLAIAQAKVIEADPAAHAERVEAARRRRYVTLTRTDEQGLRLVIARIDAGDAVWVDAVIDRVAEILAVRYSEATRDELRAAAFGWLARPAELLALLLEANEKAGEQAEPPDAAAEDAGPGAAEACEPAGGDEPGDGPGDEPGDGPGAEAAEAGQTGPAGEPDQPPGPPYVCRATAFPADLLDALRSVDPARLRPKVVLYAHLHQEAVRGGVARVEGIGAMLPEQLRDLLVGARVSLRPVIDLAEKVAVDGYEVPEWLRERVLLASPAECFPYATTVSRNVEIDHCLPYQRHGPPGQTGTDNLGPLTRSRHRVKTHGGYQVRQTGPGEYVWRTPHGLYRMVDHTGTHRIPTDLGDTIFGIPPATQTVPA